MELARVTVTGADGVTSACMLAGLSSDLLVSAAMDVSMDDLSRQLQEAIRGSDVIAQARGVLMERHGVGADLA